MRLVTSVYIYVYMYVCTCMSIKEQAVQCLTARKPPAKCTVIYCLLFKFKHLQCGLLCPASCTDRVIRTFPNKMWRPPWPRNIFFWVLTAHHTLWELAAVGLAVAPVVCSLRRMFYRLSHFFIVIHVCSRWNFRLSLCETTQASQTDVCSTEHQQLQCSYCCTCSTMKVHAHQCAQGVCSLELQFYSF